MTRYAMAVDTTLCSACGNCGMACKVANNLPDGVIWNKPKTSGGDFIFCPGGTYPDNLQMGFYTLACQHCENPACVEVCPTGASHQTEEGIVLIDQEVCIGCKSCMSACPYEGVRNLNEDEPTYVLGFPCGDADAPAHQANVMEKCTFCANRLARGERPACVDICWFGARYFGDLDDPESEVSKVLASREYEQLLAEEGTGPKVYFLK